MALQSLTGQRTSRYPESEPRARVQADQTLGQSGQIPGQTGPQDPQAEALPDQMVVQANTGAQTEWSPVSGVLGTGQSVSLPDVAPRPLTPAQALQSLEKLLGDQRKLTPAQAERFKQVYANLSPQARHALELCSRNPEKFNDLANALLKELSREKYQATSVTAKYPVNPDRKQGDPVIPPPEKVPAQQSKPLTTAGTSESRSLLTGYLDTLLAPLGITPPTQSPGEPGIVNPAPNFEHNTRVKIEVNHPEKPSHLDGTLSLFKSSELQPKVDLGWGFDLYGYCDTSKLIRPQTPASNGQPGVPQRNVYQGQMLRNDSDDWIEIEVEGSAFTSHPDDLPDGAEDRVPGTAGEKRVRGADREQAESMQSGRYRRSQRIRIPPHGAVVLWSECRDDRTGAKATEQKRGENVRSQFHINIVYPDPSKGGKPPALGVEVFLTEEPKAFGINPDRDPEQTQPTTPSLVDGTPLPTRDEGDFHGFVTIPTGSTALTKLDSTPLVSAAEIETDHNSKTHAPYEYLPRGTDFDLLDQVYQEAYQSVLSSYKGPAITPTSLIEENEVFKQHLHSFQQAAKAELKATQDHFAALRKKEGISESELAAAHDALTRVEHKVFVLDHFIPLLQQDMVSGNDSPQGELSDAEQSRYQNQIRSHKQIQWADLFPLRRMSGAMSGNQATSVIPTVELDGKGSLAYAVNTKISSGAGTTQDQSTQVLAPLMIDGRPANVSSVSHGNYGMSYNIVGSVHNPPGNGEKTLTLKFGKTNENKTDDTNHQAQSYEQSPKEMNAAFTGTVRILIPGHDPIEVDVIQGMVQQQQELEKIKVQAGETLSFKVEFMIPNNSTGPQVFELAWE
ncbi:MAG: DUF3370 family protein [Candidatus Sericytochromatia bacterium]